MTNRTTIRDVAKEANVSIATVSKALNGIDVVRPDTKERVLAAARNLHYVPNLMGKQLKNTRTKMIGFYTTSISGPYFSVLVEAIAQEAEKSGYAVNVFLSTDKRVVLRSILGGVVDGIIGFEDFLNSEDLAAIRREQIKAVFIDRNIQDEHFGSVVFDSYEKGKAATEFLLGLGHDDIAFITGIQGVYDSDERLKGYQDALSDAGIRYREDWIIHGFFEENKSKGAVDFFLKNQIDLPTAFLAGNDLSAIGTVKAIKSNGYHVPNDFSVVGFDGIDLLDYFTPSLTTVHNPIAQQGRLAVQHLLHMIEEQTKGYAHVLAGELRISHSTKRIEKY